MLGEALHRLRPDAAFVIVNGEVEWLTDGITPPTNEEIEAEISTLAAEKEMARLKAEASRLVREARFQALGTDDPAKMAEYVDKANMALLLENGQLPEADKSKLTEDAWAQRQGITDPEEVGGIWLQKSRVLRVKRDQINRAETEANERIDAGQSEAIALLAASLSQI